MTSIRKRFGTCLRQARKMRGLTQAELADAVSLSLDMIGRLERGTTSPSLESIEALAQVLGVAPAVLFGGKAASPLPGKRAALLERIERRLADANDADLALVGRLVAAIFAGR